ncbi:MAG: HNH endonuclease [Candidatus Asgardarchaeia archaeon]
MSSLAQPVLVLNKMWIPIRVASVKRCLKLIFADKASIVLPSDYSIHNWEKWASLPVAEEEEGITTTQGDIKIPEVVVLLNYDKVHRKSLRLTKRNLYIRDGYQCQYTGKQVNHKNADIDHVVPRSRGGKNSWENMVVCSRDLNRAKGNKTPQEAGLKLIKKPGKPSDKQLLFDPKLKIPSSWEKFIGQVG